MAEVEGTDPTTRAREALAACPFCGGEKVALNGAAGIWWVNCDGCGMETPTTDSQDDSTTAWNRRDPLAALIRQENEACAATIARLSADNARMREALGETEKMLAAVYGGDEGPVLLRGSKGARCARKYEAGIALRYVTRARATLDPSPTATQD